MGIYNFVSLAGVGIIAGFAWLCSSNRRVVNWRIVFWGILLQFLMAVFVFVLPTGAKFFLIMNNLVSIVLDSAKEGAEFVFGRLALSPGETNESGETSLGSFLAFQALPTIIFFAAFVSALYHLKVMPLIIRGFSYVFTKLMNISGAESLSASSNIFVGVESSLVIKPHLD
ncbi:MAG: nucleoside transporter, partial [Candidatus Aminicenantes bacterium]|nr:nucleoside transporter [Candidatus Aminicenantes bacterium]